MESRHRHHESIPHRPKQSSGIRLAAGVRGEGPRLAHDPRLQCKLGLCCLKACQCCPTLRHRPHCSLWNTARRRPAVMLSPMNISRLLRLQGSWAGSSEAPALALNTRQYTLSKQPVFTSRPTKVEVPKLPHEHPVFWPHASVVLTIITCCCIGSDSENN